MFTPTSVSSALEVRFRSNTNLDKITNGSGSTEGACTVLIKDCGIVEGVLTGGPIDTGEMDIREFFFGNYDPNTTAERFTTINYSQGLASSAGSHDTKNGYWWYH